MVAKLRYLQNFTGTITWDCLVPPELRPPRRVLPYWMLRQEDEDVVRASFC